MRRLAALIFFSFSILPGKSQQVPDTLIIDITAINEDSSIAGKTMLYIDSSASLSVSEVLNNLFIPLTDFKKRKAIPSFMVGYTYYLKLFVSNPGKVEVKPFLYPGIYFTDFDLYKLNPSPVLINNDKNKYGYKQFALSAGEQSVILIKLVPAKYESNAITPIVIRESFIENYLNFIISHKNKIVIFGYILSGVLLMMILFMLTNYAISRSTEFLYNALYSFFMFLLIFFNSVVIRSTTSFARLYLSYLDFLFLVAGTIFYIAFTRRFLNTKNLYKKLDVFLKLSERFILLLLCVYTCLYFYSRAFEFQLYLENIMKFIILSIGITFIYLALKKRNKLFNYIAAGNAILVLFSIISFLIILMGVRTYSLFKSSLFYYYIGIVLELTFFLLGLNYKNKNELIKRIKEQEALKLEAEKTEYENQIAIIKAQQEVRNRISADMHDDLGAGMTTIRLYSEMAKRKLTDNPIPEINKISTSANDLLNKMNAIIWSMSSSNDSLYNMIAYIRSYALEYFEDTGIDCKISIAEKLPNIEVTGEIRRNVFMVVKEALNNILKHANATEVNINLVRVPNGLYLYIHDNGTGINFEKLRQFGNGLKNMKKRMNDLHIDFTIENKDGTLITLYRKIENF
ncbi:MAG TPA: 7TM diverse intracellular signaling domain-containing protein [Ferruginibacter sp.]|nr:7TM diverse intracellular signaling domain-containing protein [Ferruginibacter sp.]